MAVVTDFTVGKSVTLVFITNGAIVGTASLTDFTAKQEVKKLRSDPLNSQPVLKNLPGIWSGSATLDRVDSTLDDFFAAQEDAWWSTGQTPTSYIQETINELDGSISQYRYEGVVMEFDAGARKADERIQQKIDWMGARRRKVQ